MQSLTVPFSYSIATVNTPQVTFLDICHRIGLQNPITDSIVVVVNFDVSMAAVVLLLTINVKHYQDSEASCDIFVVSGSSKSANQCVIWHRQGHGHGHAYLTWVCEELDFVQTMRVKIKD